MSHKHQTFGSPENIHMAELIALVLIKPYFADGVSLLQILPTRFKNVGHSTRDSRQSWFYFVMSK